MLPIKKNINANPRYYQSGGSWVSPFENEEDTPVNPPLDKSIGKSKNPYYSTPEKPEDKNYMDSLYTARETERAKKFGDNLAIKSILSGYKPSTTEQNNNTYNPNTPALGGTKEAPIQFPEQVISARPSNIPLRDIPINQQQRESVIGRTLYPKILTGQPGGQIQKNVGALPQQGVENAYENQRQRLGAVLDLLSSTIEKPVQNVITPIAEGERQIGTGTQQVYKNINEVPQDILNAYKISRGEYPIAPSKNEVPRGIANILGGGVKAGLGMLLPVAALNAVQPAISASARKIGGTIGMNPDTAEEIANKITPFVFGLPVGIGSLTSEAASKALDKSGAFDGLGKDDKKLALDLIQNGLFFGIAGFGGKVKTKISDLLKNKNEVSNANAEGKIQKSSEQEYQRVPRRENVPTHEGEIRKGESGQTSGSGSVKPSETEQKPEIKQGSEAQKNITNDEGKVISTAVKTDKGIITGEKPFDAHDEIAKQNKVSAPEEQRGFIVERNGQQRFVGRRVGANVAKKAGQVIEPVKELHSENLRKGVVDNNAAGIKNLTELGKTPEQIAKVLKVPVEDVEKAIPKTPIDNKLYKQVLTEYGKGYPLNSPELGEYRNEKLSTTEVFKRLDKLGLGDQVKEFQKKLDVLPNSNIQNKAEEFERLARITLREAEKKKATQPIKNIGQLPKGEDKGMIPAKSPQPSTAEKQPKENIVATKPTNIEPTSPISEPEKITTEQKSLDEAIKLAKKSLITQKGIVKPEFQQDQIIYKDGSDLLRVTNRDSFEGTKESGILPSEKVSGDIQAIVKTDGTVEKPQVKETPETSTKETPTFEEYKKKFANAPVPPEKIRAEYEKKYGVVEETKTKEAGKSKNKIFTEDEASKRASRLFDKYSKSIVGDENKSFKNVFDKQDVEDLLYIGGHFLEKGIINFADWSKEMVAKVGDFVKPHLQEIWDNVKQKTEEGKVAGIAQQIREQRADVTGVKPSDIGVGWSNQEALGRGKDLLNQGIDADQVVADFKKDGKISDDTMAIVRAKDSELRKITNGAQDKYGKDSPQYKDALKNENAFLDKIKPMQTVWSRIGLAQQGVEDIDTGTVSGLERYFKQQTGKEFTQEQSNHAKQLTDRIKSLTENEERYTKQFQELKDRYDKLVKDTTGKKIEDRNIKASAKVLANRIRTAKIHRPGAFYAATPASLAWDLGVETVAKSIEAGGEIAQAISDGIRVLKETNWYKNLNAVKKQEAEKQFTDWHNDQLSRKIEDFNFADKKGNKFTPNEASAIWKHAKGNYIDKGVTDFDDMIDGIAKDTGLSKEQVRNAIAQPKQLRVMTDEIYKARYARRRMEQNAKAWVRSANTPKVIKFLKAVPNIFFGLKVFGHGTVGMITHTGAEIYRPSGWIRYFPNFIKQFKLAYGSEAGYEKAMLDLQSDADYIFWKRNQLAIDPTRIYDDYQEIGKYFGKLGEVGNRGFQILKIHRLETAKAIWEHLSDVEKADPNTAKEVAKIVNHSTGTSNVITPKTLNVAFFAPRLEASRWARLIVEPAKALKTFSTWDRAPISEKIAAKLVTKRTGEQLATLAGLLMANQALLKLAGSNNNINFTDPTKSDWLRFKAGDKVIDPSGGMLSTMSFVSKLINVSISGQDRPMGKRETEQETDAKIFTSYVRGKLSPFISTAVDFAFHHTYMGDVMPTSNDEPGKYNEKLTWEKYLLENQTPIPVAEGIQDIIHEMKDKGLTAPTIKELLMGLGQSVVSGGTGARMRDIPKYSEPTKTNIEKAGLQDSQEIKDVQRQEKVISIIKKRIDNGQATKLDLRIAENELERLKRVKDWKDLQKFESKQTDERNKKYGKHKRSKDPAGILGI